jgi:acyl-CoA thioesterase FadM
MYRKTLVAGWSDMDFNAHMGAQAYLAKCFDVRMMYFAENGYPMGEFARLRLGPVGMKDELEYFREVGLLQEIVVTLSVAGMSADGTRWRLRQEVLRSDGVRKGHQHRRVDGSDRAQTDDAAGRPPGLVQKGHRGGRLCRTSVEPEGVRRRKPGRRRSGTRPGRRRHSQYN